jgi:NAD(P)-dependent dehydrogenase (short-subunit alcohol dehydrogenase family)
LLVSRSPGDLASVRRSILSEVPGCRVEVFAADVSQGALVQALADFATATFGGMEALVCNAGVYGPKGPIEDVDWNDWMQTIAVNLVGVVQCVRAFAPLMKASSHGKVVILSGGGATKPMPFLSAYAVSKTAVVRFGETLAEEWKPRGIDVNMVAPGPMNTGMLDEILEAGPEKVGQAYYAAALKQKQSGGTPMERGAALCVFLGSRQSDGITGKLISAVWDPWERLTELRGDLESSDVYTLRRVLPRERGFDW